MHAYVQHQDEIQDKLRKPFSLKDIQAPFYILIFGYIISFIVFLVEKFILTPEKLCKFKKCILPVKRIANNIEKGPCKNIKQFCRDKNDLNV